VTQTVAYAPPGVATTFTDVRSSVLSSLTLTAPEGTAADPTACGAPVDGIAALASPTTNPAPLTLSTGFHPTPSTYPFYPLTPAVANDGTTALEGRTSEPMVLAVRDGVVVGRAQASGALSDLGRIAPGGSHAYADPPFAERCPGTPEPAWGGSGLPAGDYQLWVVVHVTLTSPRDVSWDVAAGPIPWTATANSASVPTTSAAGVGG
jgi:hypothetical protein